eukprot:TRINITY_DN13515_c0_g1_i2.p1 TRINITY_DN13515_c0_g1~~TRINITY_DN13515_c0_g1_i2.p1  ORF type:complete len:247 (+),score=62.04 TRINITY_DN13515_c0_g1_i2:65-805(+)
MCIRDRVSTQSTWDQQHTISKQISLSLSLFLTQASTRRYLQMSVHSSFLLFFSLVVSSQVLLAVRQNSAGTSDSYNSLEAQIGTIEDEHDETDLGVEEASYAIVKSFAIALRVPPLLDVLKCYEGRERDLLTTLVMLLRIIEESGVDGVSAIMNEYGLLMLRTFGDEANCIIGTEDFKNIKMRLDLEEASMGNAQARMVKYGQRDAAYIYILSKACTDKIGEKSFTAAGTMLATMASLLLTGKQPV